MAKTGRLQQSCEYGWYGNRYTDRRVLHPIDDFESLPITKNTYSDDMEMRLCSDLFQRSRVRRLRLCSSEVTYILYGYDYGSVGVSE